MDTLRGSCVVGQSGGPTAVINSSAAGIIISALEHDEITHVYAMENGIVGLLEDRLFDCAKESIDELKLLRYTPSSALGSCRYKLAEYTDDDSDYRRILEIFIKYDIRYFFYIGGNDSMDTCNKISKFMQNVGYECRIIGVPKTIDNDLFGTDHCPGFGTAAKFIATVTAEISKDNQVYGTKSVVVIEAMGRNAGWLAASAALASVIGDGPDLVYLPENVFSVDRFISDVRALSEQKNSIIAVVSEGVRNNEGRFISEYGSTLSKQKDVFGHAQMGGLAATLAGYINSQTGLKTRGIELSLLQRASAHIMSGRDSEEAYRVGVDAVRYATVGHSDVMVAFERELKEEYCCKTLLRPLVEVANKERLLPQQYINRQKNNITDEFIKYALPLIEGNIDYPKKNGLPVYAKLKKMI